MSAIETTETEFTALSAHPSLARALAHKGYATPSPVQAAVLGAPERDLLVSAQTGSGKTVAFGLVVARVLLGDAEKLAPATHPRALVVAPTRELAIQVKKELAWLFAGTSTRIDACTGGTDTREDMRALKRGVDIVVGTPGRLVDLIERKSLDLSQLQVVVLDEADEMLDLGFRDALELLLSTAPKERRTLMFSATLPKPIRTLATRYQNNAFSLDARSGVGAAHEDIRHVAHLCKNGERFAVLVNTLRLIDEERAIVFCRTRDGVGELERRLVTAGFRATAISGDRAQADRTRALDSLRKGGMNVLVATNVAARGLDLPDVRLVVHVDLPENAESLTHRSGRTGRAGKKGDNLFIVEQREQRRAERLFREARLQLSWTPAPSAEAVAAHDAKALRVRVTETAAKQASTTAITLAEELLADHDATALVAALLDGSLASRPPGEKVTVLSARPVPGKVAPLRTHAPMTNLPRPHVVRGEETGEMVLFQVNLGEKDRAQANWILPLVCRRGAITRREVGSIRIEKSHTLFEIAADVAKDFAANVAERDPRAPHVVIELAESRRAGKDSAAPRNHYAPRPAARDQARPAPREIARPTREHAPREHARPAAREHARPAPREHARPAPREHARPAPRATFARPGARDGSRPPARKPTRG